jgi:hypothetical protein
MLGLEDGTGGCKWSEASTVWSHTPAQVPKSGSQASGGEHGVENHMTTSELNTALFSIPNRRWSTERGGRGGWEGSIREGGRGNVLGMIDQSRPLVGSSFLADPNCLLSLYVLQEEIHSPIGDLAAWHFSGTRAQFRLEPAKSAIAWPALPAASRANQNA